MAEQPYDVVIVGARVAGSATAMLMARRGLRVLVVDRASFPSDTLSTHQIQVPGVARLARWGLLDPLVAAGTPATRRVRLEFGGVVLDGSFPPFEHVDALYSPRRFLLDTMLIEAAQRAGVEVWERFAVEDVVWRDGRVVGIRGRRRDGATVTVPTRLVVGADGKHSTIAKAVAAKRRSHQAPATLACYTYWSGVPLDRGELYHGPGYAAAAFPTNDSLTMVYVAAPIADFARFRVDLQANYLALLDRCGDLGQRVRAGRRAERVRATPDLPQIIRQAYGPGWALVGDAGLVMDPISAQGITNAFRDAETLADAVSAAYAADAGPEASLPAHLARYERRRDAVNGPMYAFTQRLAQLRPPGVLERGLLSALRRRQTEVDRFLGVFAGITSIREYRSVSNVVRMLGVGGIAKLAGDLIRGSAGPVDVPARKLT